MTASLMIISNRLPISVSKTNAGLVFYPSVGGLATGLASYTKSKKNKWIGWPGIASDLLTQEEKDKIAKKLATHNYYPVFLTQKQLDGFYNGYSNRILWPLFHNLPISPNAIGKQNEYWEMYKQVNAIYADCVLKLHEPGTNIWVNDYQLMLLPTLLREKMVNDKIGFFLHIPFPNMKSFTKLMDAKDILLGVMGAELVGFHTKSYSKNFINNCQRQKIGLLTEDCIALDDRIIRISSFPMGINYAKFLRAVNLKTVKKSVIKLHNKYRDRKVILTVDRLDRSKGLIERVSAYRNLLLTNKTLHNNIVMIMLVVPSRTQIEEYQKYRIQLEEIINETNNEFRTPTWEPIEYKYTSLSFEKLVTLYQLADIAFITPLVDGMNLVAKEFVASKQNKNGVLILSKTAGAAEELHDALIVNPTSQKSLAKALSRAIAMPKSEMRNRLRNMQKHISVFTVKYWANDFLDSLINSPNIPIVRTKSLSYGWQLELIAAYNSALKRVLLLDYDGTLTPFVDKPELAEPSIELKQQLKILSNSKKNRVILVSGRDKDSLGNWFNDVPITLLAEHGSFIRRAGEKKWSNIMNFNTSWKPMILTVLEKHAVKVPGSFIEQKQTSLVWHYRIAKPIHVKKYLTPLKQLLQPLAKKLNLKIEQGNMILEIRPVGANKGTSTLKYSKNADFVLAIGDDATDEEMFSALPPAVWTIKVGTGTTAARYRMKNVGEVHELLKKLG